jgi:hypothetical protein
LRDVEADQEILQLDITASVTTVAISPDEQYVAAASLDNYCCVVYLIFADHLSILELIGTFLVRKLFKSFCDGA